MNNQAETQIDSRLPIDIAGCYRTPPMPRDYVLPGFMPGTVGSIIAPGATSKSMLGLMLAHIVGGGVDLLGLGKLSTGRVVYLSAEDGENILHERLHAIGKRLSPDDRAACAGMIHLEDLTKYTPDLLCEKTGQGWRQEIEKLCCNSRLMLLDTLRTFHGADENKGDEMATLIGHLRAIASRTRCSILFLHHSSKALAIAGQGDMQQAARGSSVLTDNVRWQAYLAGMTIEESKKLSARMDGREIGQDDRVFFVRFGVSKQNYGAPFPERWFRRGEGGVLEQVVLKPAKPKDTDPKETKIVGGRRRGNA